MTYQEKISQAAEEIHELIEPVIKRLGLQDINNRTQSDILVLVHALREIQDLYLDEISDGQFKKK